MIQTTVLRIVHDEDREAIVETGDFCMLRGVVAEDQIIPQSPRSMFSDVHI